MDVGISQSSCLSLPRKLQPRRAQSARLSKQSRRRGAVVVTTQSSGWSASKAHEGEQRIHAVTDGVAAQQLYLQDLLLLPLFALGDAASSSQHSALPPHVAIQL